MTETTEAIPAETAELMRGMDASRRAGWATAFENREKVDDLLRELNLAREDADLYRRVASYLYGYLQETINRLPGFTVTDAARVLREYMQGMGATGEDGGVRAGTADARKAMNDWSGATPELIRLQQVKLERQRERQNAHRGERELMRSLAEQYRTKPGIVRATLKALRQAVTGNGTGAAMKDGLQVHIALRR